MFKLSHILTFIIFWLNKTTALKNQTCTSSTQCQADASICVNKVCSPCKVDFDCYHLNMYSCQSGIC